MTHDAEADAPMQHLSATGRQALLDIQRRYGFSDAAVASMLQSVAAGRGRMAQFDHAEFGGRGQWLSGGMTMLSDLFDTTLKTRVAGLCHDLAGLLADESAVSQREAAPAPRAAPNRTPETSDWWPGDFGRPSSAGAQNGIRYAYFAAPRRLAVEDARALTVYDTLDHAIGGVAQQQTTSSTLTFRSQHGTVDLASLPVVRAERRSGAPPAAESDSVATLEKLADLRDKGIVTDDEFAAKKAKLPA